METQQQQNTGTNAGADPVSAIANALGKLFDVASVALKPAILATQAYFQQLLNAQPKMQNPYADVNANRRQMAIILVIGGIILVGVLLVAVILKNRKKA